MVLADCTIREFKLSNLNNVQYMLFVYEANISQSNHQGDFS